MTILLGGVTFGTEGIVITVSILVTTLDGVVFRKECGNETPVVSAGK